MSLAAVRVNASLPAPSTRIPAEEGLAGSAKVWRVVVAFPLAAIGMGPML